MAAKKKVTPQFSQAISEACKMMDEALRDYRLNQEELVTMDKLTQDYLHRLELEELDYKSRAKVATQLRDCRRTRREIKDTLEVLAPLIQFLESDRGRNMLNLLREALGKTRKVEEHMKNRYYRPRVLSTIKDSE